MSKEEIYEKAKEEAFDIIRKMNKKLELQVVTSEPKNDREYVSIWQAFTADLERVSTELIAKYREPLTSSGKNEFGSFVTFVRAYVEGIAKGYLRGTVDGFLEGRNIGRNSAKRKSD